MFPPSRIVCLTEETVETLYLLGEQGRIVGISGYVVRPPQARLEKPRVSAFTSANIDKILSLRPDLVLTFSDLQADIVADLIRRGIEVHAFNQRTMAGILDMTRMVGAMVGASYRAEELVRTFETRLAEARRRGERLPKRPRVFFEEWDDPLISAIGWVSELVDIASGIDIFSDRRHQGAAKDRVVTAEEVVDREPDLIIEELKELNHGVFEMKSHDELMHDPGYQRWIGDIHNEAPPGGESRTAFEKRVKAGLDNLLCIEADSIVVVSHGGVIVSIMERLFPGQRNFYQWQPRNGRGYTLDISNKNAILISEI